MWHSSSAHYIPDNLLSASCALFNLMFVTVGENIPVI